jgi:hypothetical protein
MTGDGGGLAILGAMGFGALIGWYLYYINRHRTSKVGLGDLVTLVGAVGGSAILAAFPARSALFGGYGIGLFLGFFGYFGVLAWNVSKSDSFDRDFFIDGRRKRLPTDEFIPSGPSQGAMGTPPNDDPSVRG